MGGATTPATPASGHCTHQAFGCEESERRGDCADRKQTHRLGPDQDQN